MSLKISKSSSKDSFKSSSSKSSWNSKDSGPKQDS